MGNLWSRWTEFVWSSTLMKNNRKYTACDSPECVRCHRYQQVREEAWDKLQRYADKHGWEGLVPLLLAVGEGKRYRDVRSRLGRDRESLMPLPLQNPNILFVPTVRKIPWWEAEGDTSADTFSDEKKTLEANHNVILEEFETVFKDVADVSPKEVTGTEGQAKVKQWTVNSTEKGCWCVYHLYNQGQKVTENCNRCPQTTKLVEGLASVMTGCLFGNVTFSVLYPETHIEEHYGPCNVRIRCHLGKDKITSAFTKF